MIRDPLFIVILLLAIEILVLYFSEHPRYRSFFKFLPSVFWIYFLPMVASSVGLIDPKSPIYQTVTSNLLPASLFLLLICVDLKAIVKLGRLALLMFFIGNVGIMVGIIVVFFLFEGIVGKEFWSGFGALSASWMGGSANMIAVKEALGTPDAVFLPMVVVDTIVPFVWMGMLVAVSSFQKQIDQWNHAQKGALDDISHRLEGLSIQQKKIFSLPVTVFIFCLGLVMSFAGQWLAKFFPVVKDMLSTFAWTIIIVSSLGLLFSLTRLKQLESYGSTRVGYFFLFFVLTTIGAKANISNLGSSVILIGAGFLVVFIHSAVVLLAAKILRAPVFLAAVSIQANIGGVASAPIVAEIYRPGLAAVGLLMAILGNIVGTYFGIITSQVCLWISRM